MPDDYQQLFEDLSSDEGFLNEALNTINPPAANSEGTPLDDSVVTDSVTDSENNTIVPDGTEIPDDNVIPTDIDAEKAEVIAQEEIRAKAFAEQRAQISKYSKVFKKMQETMGVRSEEEVIERLLGAAYGAEAKTKNVDPSILREINELKEKNQQNDQLLKTNYLTEEFAKVQKEFSLTNAEVAVFVKQLTKENVDIFSNNIPLGTLYRGLNHDAITEKALDARKQEWIKSQAEADKAPGVNSSTGKKDTGPKPEINSIAELDSLLENYPNK